ncbi:MAG: NAD-dependent epimerase/dehydratase family protein [Thermoguttaceae bacterium]
MKVIVAGGTGFLGNQVTTSLLAAGHRVVLLARGTRTTASAEGVEVVLCDVGAGPIPLEPLRDSDALVNLVGIKREEGTQTFARVHVDAMHHLLAAAKVLGLRRFVHVSVVCSRPDSRSGYHNTKWLAEELVRASDLDFTILKPGVIYGPGDDMVTHLVKMIRFAPIFPLVGRGKSILQPVHARDVAQTALRALDCDRASGKTYDVVGPKRMTLREVVRTVAEGVGLKLWIVDMPIGFHRIAVHLMSLARRPLSTPAQLQMLVDGLYGDPGPAEADLGVEPSPFTVDVVRELASSIPPLFGFSLRLVAGQQRNYWSA